MSHKIERGHGGTPMQGVQGQKVPKELKHLSNETNKVFQHVKSKSGNIHAKNMKDREVINKTNTPPK